MAKLGAVIKVRTKTTFRNCLCEIAVGRGDDAHVDRDVGACADATHSAFLQDAQQLRLRRKIQRVNFVEKQRAAGSFFKETAAVLVRARERAALVTEEFGFDECFGNGGTVDIDEGVIASWDSVVDCTGGKFFAGSGSAGNEYRSVGWRHAFDHGEQFFHHRRLADESGSFGTA